MSKMIILAVLAVFGTFSILAACWQFLALIRLKIHVGNGRITGSRIEVTELRNSKGRTWLVYRPFVMFEYGADGGIFRGDRISWLTLENRDLAKVEKIIQAYPEGREVQVFYNAKNPKHSYLKNPKVHAWTALSFGIFMLMVLWGPGWQLWLLIR